MTWWCGCGRCSARLHQWGAWVRVEGRPDVPVRMLLSVGLTRAEWGTYRGAVLEATLLLPAVVDAVIMALVGYDVI